MDRVSMPLYLSLKSQSNNNSIGVCATNMPVLWVTHTKLFLNRTHLQSHSSRSHRRCLSGEGLRHARSFFKAPAVLPHCGIMINFSTTSPRKSPFSFCSLCLRFLLEKKTVTDQTRSDQTAGLPSFDMSNSIPVVKLTIFPKHWYVYFSSSCKAVGKTEKQAGSLKTDAVCGVPSPGRLFKMFIFYIYRIYSYIFKMYI